MGYQKNRMAGTLATRKLWADKAAVVNPGLLQELRKILLTAYWPPPYVR